MRTAKVVRWIGPPDAEEPAPLVTLTEAEPHHGGSDTAADDDEAAPMGLAVVGLVVGGLGLLTGGVALGRPTAAEPDPLRGERVCHSLRPPVGTGGAYPEPLPSSASE